MTIATHADQAVVLVHEWLARAQGSEPSAASKRLARLVADPEGLAFAVAFVDGTIRPEDHTVAARNLAAAARMPTPFLSGSMAAALRIGGRLAPLAPWLAVPVTRGVLRGLVGHLVLDSRPRHLGRGLATLRKQGVKVNANLLGEAVLGHDQAAARLAGILELIEREDVDYVSLKVSSVVAPHSPWGFDAAVAHITDTLRPVYVAAKRSGTFVNLDMEEYRDLELTMAVFTALLDEPELNDLYAGIVLQAYLPDALPAMHRLREWASGRVSRGGAPVKVRVVKGANLSMEHVDAEWHGWPLATWDSKEATDAHYKRILDDSLRPEHTAAVKIGVAGHNLFDLAFAWTLARERGVTAHVDVEMLLGMAEQIAPAVAQDVGPVRLYTPVVPPAEFDVAIAYLVRRLEEVANPANFLSSAFRFAADPGALAVEEARFRASLARMEEDVPGSHRDWPLPNDAWGFTNQPDSDPATATARGWAQHIVERATSSGLGQATIGDAWVGDADAASEVVAAAVAAGRRWGTVEPNERADVLELAGRALEAARGQLIEVMCAEAGKTFDQADPEVSEVVDFANYYAAAARDLATVPGVKPVPRALTLVTPPWNFPIAIPGGSVLAALAAGSAVILKPAPVARRCAAVLAEVLWEAGVPRDVLRLVDCDEEPVGSALVRDERIDQIVLTGAFETAALFTNMRPGVRLLAETSGKNALIVTPSADLDLAARDVVQSAFGHAGQKCSAASLVVLVGSVAQSRRFMAQLKDAATSLTVGESNRLASQVGPLIEAPRGKLLNALTEIGPRQQWLLRPEPLNDDRTLWSPGIIVGVEFGDSAHLIEFFGPVLSVMTAPTLDAAIDIVNAVDYGLTSGLHSLDAGEIQHWLQRVDAGNLYVNRGITGAIVGRQPFGGWKRSAVGPGAKAGGPHYVEKLTGWEDVAELPDQEWLAAASASDATAMASDFQPSDPSALTCERNVLRYVPAPTEIRVAADARDRDVLRVAAAAELASRGALASFTTPPDAGLADALTSRGLVVAVEDDAVWTARITSQRWARVRAVGTVTLRTMTGEAAASVTIYDDPVTVAGRLELLPFLREQAISMTAHRFGTPARLAHEIVVAAARSAS